MIDPRHPSPTTEQPRVTIVQDTARLQYAVPLALQRAGMLERMYTDFYMRRGSPTALLVRMMKYWRPAIGRQMAGRRCDEIDDRLVRGHVRHGISRVLRRPREPVPASFWIWSAESMGEWILRRGFGEANMVMAFINGVDPRVLQAARARRLVTLGDQVIAPIAVELTEARVQMERWPAWEPTYSLEELRNFEPFQLRTWSELDHFTCASDYVRDGLVAQGIAADRITVIPYPIELQGSPMIDRAGRNGPLTVGFIGDVSLRKGAPYFFEVARRLRDREVRFLMVGRVRLDPSIVRSRPPNIELTGQVPHSDVQRHLRAMDLLLFPSTCEGSAAAVIEAMASGLPVVVSPNSGSFARDAVEGFVCSYDDTNGLTDAVQRLVDDEDLRLRMGLAARQRVQSYDVDAYSRRVSILLRSLLEARARGDHAPAASRSSMR